MQQLLDFIIILINIKKILILIKIKLDSLKIYLNKIKKNSYEVDLLNTQLQNNKNFIKKYLNFIYYFIQNFVVSIITSRFNNLFLILKNTLININFSNEDFGNFISLF